LQGDQRRCRGWRLPGGMSVGQFVLSLFVCRPPRRQRLLGGDDLRDLVLGV
jgi:hypothetical protein